MDLADVERVAVLGAGNMGHGIAEVAAIAGYEVAIRDISEELVQEGYQGIEWSLGKLVEHDRLTEEDADAALSRVTPVVEMAEAVGDADVVVEAVPERMDVKEEVWGEVAEHAPDRAVFASNTSSISITAIAEATDRPERFCGMHFFNPPVRMALVEVIAGERTAEETLGLVEDLAESMDKTPVRVRKDSPGFIVNRVLTPQLNEAAWMVETGEATVAEVDSTTKFGMGMPMGAFELADQVGLDVAVDVLEYLHEQLGDAYEPCPLLAETVEAGDLGQKAGAGFYDYDDGGADVPGDEQRDDVATRLTAVMANEVAKLVGGDVADPAAIDEAMRLGAGFPDGPAKVADEAGLGTLRDALAERHEETGSARYEPADLLVEYADAGRGFYADRSDEDADASGADYESIAVSREGAVGRIVIDRPHRMNTLTPDLLGELDAAMDDFEADDAVRAVLVTGAGDRAFSAGADAGAYAGSLEPIDAADLSRRGQRVFGRLESSDMPVVAGIDGYCLGGGMELATACDLRIASERSEFGQPELDLAIVPAWGGTQRLRHIVGDGRAKEIILTTDRYDAETMAEYGFVNEVVGNDELQDAAMELASDLAAGPPIATAYTKRAMLAGRGDVDAGLAVESAALGITVTTDDFIEGVTAFMGDREPEFEGK